MPLTRNRHLNRYRQITASLARHGLGGLIPELGLLWSIGGPIVSIFRMTGKGNV